MEQVKNTSEAQPATDEKPESFVDSLFDTLTERAAKALVVAAGWLEAQAKVVRNLATKLEKPAQPTA